MNARATESDETRRGMTLVEILVVMSIIVIISGGVIVAASKLWRRSQKKRTEALIYRLEAALEDYKAECHHYPPDNGGPFHPANSGFDEALRCGDHGNRNLYYALMQAGLAYELKGDDLSTDLPHANFTTDPKLPPRVIVDAWGRTVFYNSHVPDGATYYSDEAHTTEFKQVGYAVQIYSLGPDGKAFYMTGDRGDDIRNYRE